MSNIPSFPRRRAVCMLVGAALCAVLVPRVHAQLAEKPIRFVLPVGAGSGVDTITRAAAPALTKALGQTIVIENQAGAGGIVGTTTLVRAAPDGQTLSVISNNHVIYPSVYKSVPFDPINDVTPIAIIGTTPIVLAVNPSKIPATNLKDLIALFKAKPDVYNYGSSGNGTILHLAAELFVDEAQVKLRHVPYKGVGPMVTDIIGGQVEMGMVALPSIQGHLKNGTLRAIAVGGKQRIAAAPEIPTLAESGLPNYEAEGWFAVIGPAKLPAADVKRIHDAFVAAFDSPDVKEAMAKQGNTIRISTPEFAGQFMKTEMAKYARLVQKSGMKPD